MSRIAVYCLVEGFSEAALVKRILAPHFSNWGIDIYAPTVKTRRDRKAGRVYSGGGDTFAHYRNDLDRLFRQWRQHENVWFTTMIDLYALPSDFPGKDQGMVIADYRAKVAFLEGCLGQVAAELGGGDRFIPHLALHEFETLLLVNVPALGTLFLDKDHEIQGLQREVAKFQDVEQINDTPHGAPSKRIEKWISVYKRYKRSDQSGAVNVLEVVGLQELRLSCQHFDGWIRRIENLNPIPF